MTAMMAQRSQARSFLNTARPPQTKMTLIKFMFPRTTGGKRASIVMPPFDVAAAKAAVAAGCVQSALPWSTLASSMYSEPWTARGKRR